MKTLLTAYAARPFPGNNDSRGPGMGRQLSARFTSRHDVALMVSELVTNALRYSRSGQPGGWVTVILMIGDSRSRS